MSIWVEGCLVGVYLEVEMVLGRMTSTTACSDEFSLLNVLVDSHIDRFEMFVSYEIIIRCLYDDAVAFVLCVAVSMFDPGYYAIADALYG